MALHCSRYPRTRQRKAGWHLKFHGKVVSWCKVETVSAGLARLVARNCFHGTRIKIPNRSTQNRESWLKGGGYSSAQSTVTGGANG